MVFPEKLQHKIPPRVGITTTVGYFSMDKMTANTLFFRFFNTKNDTMTSLFSKRSLSLSLVCHFILYIFSRKIYYFVEVFIFCGLATTDLHQIHEYFRQNFHLIFFCSFRTTSAATNGQKKSSINFLFGFLCIYLTNSSAHFKFNNLSKLCKKKSSLQLVFYFLYFFE